MRPAADAKSIRLVADLPPGMTAVSGDADRLLQVTWNILSNAVKFTDEGGMVVVSLRSDRAGTHLAVADTGQGIEPKFLSQVFDRFKQADTSAARRSGGLGLGLALVKDLVAMHGGTVEAASPGPGLGSTFSIYLPNRIELPERLVARPAVTPAETTLDGIRVLIVEDDPDAREIAERSISDAGGSAIAVGNAIDALAALAHGGAKPNALVSDIGLPGTDGYDLLDAMRGLPNERGAIPAIAVTAYASAGDAQLAIKRGFAAHITKPYSPSVLVAAVRDAIDRSVNSNCARPRCSSRPAIVSISSRQASGKDGANASSSAVTVWTAAFPAHSNPSVHSQRLHRILAGRAPRRDVAGDRGNHQHQHRRAADRDRIGRRHAEQESAQQSGAAEHADQSDADADRRYDEPAHHDQLRMSSHAAPSAMRTPISLRYCDAIVLSTP